MSEIIAFVLGGIICVLLYRHFVDHRPAATQGAAPELTARVEGAMMAITSALSGLEQKVEDKFHDVMGQVSPELDAVRAAAQAAEQKFIEEQAAHAQTAAERDAAVAKVATVQAAVSG